MKNRTMLVRVVAIVLCALMVFGVIAGAVSILAHGAYEGGAQAVVASAETGSSNNSYWPVILGIVAATLLVLCIVLPKFKKKPEAPGGTAEIAPPAQDEVGAQTPEDEEKPKDK